MGRGGILMVTLPCMTSDSKCILAIGQASAGIGVRLLKRAAAPALTALMFTMLSIVCIATAHMPLAPCVIVCNAGSAVAAASRMHAADFC